MFNNCVVQKYRFECQIYNIVGTQKRFLGNYSTKSSVMNIANQGNWHANDRISARSGTEVPALPKISQIVSRNRFWDAETGFGKLHYKVFCNEFCQSKQLAR